MAEGARPSSIKQMRDPAHAQDAAAAPMDRLLSIMAHLRDPDSGCPWDVQQTSRTIARYTIEEAYEVVDAIERGDLSEMKEELGDLLLQVVFHAQMAQEAGAFSFEDVAAAICGKMIRRHPHVFGSAEDRDAHGQTLAWEALKAEERAAKGDDDTSVLANVPVALPALTRAEKLMKRAARVGFDWPDAPSVLAKVDEELAEVREAVSEGDHAHIHEEIGDLLSTVVNVARKLGVDPETALRDSNAKFERRFRFVEQQLAASGSSLQEADLDAMEAQWLSAKSQGL